MADFLHELVTNFFIHIISAKDLLFFIIWCILDTVLFLTVTKDFTLNTDTEKRKIKNKMVLILQYKQIILSALLVFCINIFIKNSDIPITDLLKTLGLELEINTQTTLSILLTLLYIPTFFKISREFKKNNEKKNKVEEEND